MRFSTNQFVIVDQYDGTISAVVETELSREELAGVIADMKNEFPADYDQIDLEEALAAAGCSFTMNPEVITW